MAKLLSDRRCHRAHKLRRIQSAFTQSEYQQNILMGKSCQALRHYLQTFQVERHIEEREKT